MVKPHADVSGPVEQRHVESPYMVVEQPFGKNTDIGLENTQKLSEYSKNMTSDLVLNQYLDMQDDLEKQKQKILEDSFNNIQSDHRHGRVDEDLYGDNHVSKCLDQDNSRNLSHDLGVLDGCNIDIKVDSFGQELATLKQKSQIKQNPMTLVDENEKPLYSLGNGTAAECILCQNENTQKLVVHKKYYGKPREREFETLKALRDHRGIPAVYGTAMEDGRHVLRMEFCGNSLRQWRKNRRVTETEIWQIFEQLTDVVSFLDHHGVTHQDIKPDNACINCDFNIKLIDFGSVKTTQDKVSQGERITAAYMAPEMWLWYIYRITPISSKVDVFACGLTICFLVYESDVVPEALETNDPNQILYKMIEHPSRVAEYVGKTFPLGKYSPALKKLLLKTLDGDPCERISAADAHEQIVKQTSPSIAHANEDEEIKCLGIDMVTHSTSLNILTPSATAPFTETVLGVGGVYHVPDFEMSQRETSFPSARVAINSITDCHFSLETSGFPSYSTDPMRKLQATSPFGTELTLPNESYRQPTATTSNRIISTEAPRVVSTGSGNQQIGMVGTSATSTTVRYEIALCTSPNTTMRSNEPMNSMAGGSSQQGLATHVSKAMAANEGSKSIVLKTQPMIPHQEQLQAIQDFVGSNHHVTLVNEETAISKAVQDNNSLQEDCHDDIQRATITTEESDRQAKPEVLKKLSDRVKNGSRKRNYPDFPTKFTNLPNLDMIQCKKKR